MLPEAPLILVLRSPKPGEGVWAELSPVATGSPSWGPRRADGGVLGRAEEEQGEGRQQDPLGARGVSRALSRPGAQARVR